MPGDFDTVKERVDIAQVIGAYVPLKKAGRIYKALCPFHTEKTPSFTVDPDRRTYKCFACGKGGDVFTFLEEKAGLSRGEALEQLAKEAGVELTRRKPEEREEHKRLIAAHEAAHFYFRQALRGTEGGKGAAAYLEKRGIRPETIDRFGLGYAPDLLDGLLAYLRKKGFSDAEAVESGLIVRTERGALIDRFRGRVMIPIRDAKGRPIGFAGRALRADERAKYINSPATPLFEKSRVLFALDLARPEIRKSKEAIVVEGQFDAVAAHQAGVRNLVASMGTALTVQQYELLRPVAERAVIAFDADPAGVKAAESRGRELLALADRVLVRAGKGSIAAAVGLDLFVAVLPPGTDPDVLVRTDPDRFRDAIAEAKPVVEFLLDALSARHRLGTPVGRRDYLREAMPLLASVSDPLTRGVYLDRLSRTTGVSQAALEDELRTLRGGTRQSEAEAEAGGKRKGTPERYVVAQLLRFPDQARRLELSPEDVSDPELRSLYELIRAAERVERYPEALAALRAELVAEAEGAASYEEVVTAVEQAALRVRERRLRRRLEEARAAFSRQPDDAGLAENVTELVGELARVKEALERHTSLEPLMVEEE
ncbi:MAG TPA: DNA primase [Candidatus Dormibacteraeota bacterium]|jgi:DNA primase|nr:DNA primase [Candidatus Dormibacteraeota bacterium]